MTDSLLDEVRLGKYQPLVDDRARRVALSAKPFTLTRDAGLWVRNLAEGHRRLVDELRPFALAPFDRLAVSCTFPPFEGSTDVETLHLWDHGQYKALVRQDGRTAVIPGWMKPDGRELHNDVVEAGPDASAIMERLHVDYDVLCTIFLLLAQPSAYQISMGEPRRSTMRQGRLIKFLASSEITLRLDKPAQLRRLFRTGSHATPRRHEVRRHWWHFGGEHSHAHVWAREETDDGKLLYRCSCGRIRRERGPFERGDAGRGFVQQRYKVEA